MSVEQNTIANYIGQGYTTIIGIVMLPLYLEYLGAEAYGLVGFFAVMQSWLALLDMGLTPALSRQVAHQRGQKEGQSGLLQLLRSIEWLFGVMAVAIAICVWAGSHWIAREWLTVETLAHSEVAYCIALMGFMTGLRWFSSLYRSGIQGMEKMVWLNVASIGLATLRFVGVYALLRWVTHAPADFFEFQLVVSLLELALLAWKFHACLSGSGSGDAIFSWSAIKTVLPFAGGVAYTSALWVFLTQTDKMILSRALTLKEYGYFSLVVVVTNGLINLGGPISQAILPRMTILLSQGDEAGMLMLYRKATLLTATIVFPVVGTIAVFPTEILYAWTGNHEAADWAGPVLRWFALGNGILAVAAFQYYLQYAYGKLRLHIINTTVSVLAQVPLLAYAAFEYGALGVAYAWFGIRLLSFLIFPAIVHKQLVPGFHRRWVLESVLIPCIVSSVVASIGWGISSALKFSGRLQTVAIIGSFLFLMLLSNVVSASRFTLYTR